MKRLILALAAVAAVATSPLAAQSKLDFTRLNKTGLPIEYVDVSPTNDDERGEDVMGRDVLAHGESVDIVSPAAKNPACGTLKVKDEDGRLQPSSKSHTSLITRNPDRRLKVFLGRRKGLEPKARRLTLNTIVVK